MIFRSAADDRKELAAATITASTSSDDLGGAHLDHRRGATSTTGPRSTEVPGPASDSTVEPSKRIETASSTGTVACPRDSCSTTTADSDG